MKNQIKILTEKLRDERSKKVIFVSHCILNENVRYLGGAFRKGGVDEIIDALQEQSIGIVQMKCPEQRVWGGVLKKELLRAYGIRNTLMYHFVGLYIPLFILYTKRKYKVLAKQVVMEIKDYIDSGFEVVGILGIGGSPSCGVNKILDIEKSIEFLTNTKIENIDRNESNHVLLRKCSADGSGFFVEALKNELKQKNIEVRFFEHDLVSEMDQKPSGINKPFSLP